MTLSIEAEEQCFSSVPEIGSPYLQLPNHLHLELQWGSYMRFLGAYFRIHPLSQPPLDFVSSSWFLLNLLLLFLQHPSVLGSLRLWETLLAMTSFRSIYGFLHQIPLFVCWYLLDFELSPIPDIYSWQGLKYHRYVHGPYPCFVWKTLNYYFKFAFTTPSSARVLWVFFGSVVCATSPLFLGEVWVAVAQIPRFARCNLISQVCSIRRQISITFHSLFPLPASFYLFLNFSYSFIL